MKVTILALLILSQTLCQENELDALTFLSEQIQPLIFLGKPNPEDLREVAKGFMKGLVIFEGVAAADECSQLQKDVVSNVNDLIDAVKEIKEDVTGSFMTIVANVKSIINKLKKVKGPCKEIAMKAKHAAAEALDYMKSFSYVKKLPGHIKKGIAEMKSKAQTAKALMNSDNWKEAGQAYGDLIHFIFLWDYTPTPQ
jgi:hypothetical protein